MSDPGPRGPAGGDAPGADPDAVLLRAFSGVSDASEAVNSSHDGDSGPNSAQPSERDTYLTILDQILQEQLAIMKENAEETGEQSYEFSPDIVDLDMVGEQQLTGAPILYYAQGGSPGSGFCFFLDNFSDEDTTVRMVVPDVPGIFSAATNGFELEGLDIVHCEMERLDELREGWAYIECRVLTNDGDLVEGFALVKTLCDRIREVLTMRLQSARQRRPQNRNPKRSSNHGNIRTHRLSSFGSGGATVAAPARGSAPHAALSKSSEDISSSEPSPKEPGCVASLPTIPGSPSNRSTLAKSLSDGMVEMSEATEKGPTEGESKTWANGASNSNMHLLDQPADESILKVGRVMSSPLHVVRATATANVALRQMSECKRSCLIVDNGPGIEPGLVTKFDFLSKEYNTTTVGDIQTREVVAIHIEASVKDAARLMSQKRIQRVLVKDMSLDDPIDRTLKFVGEVTEDILVDLSVSHGTSRDSDGSIVASTSEGHPPGHTSTAGVSESIGQVEKNPWEICYSELTLVSRIGQGSFGEVWQGKWRGTEVAVKRVWGLQGSIEEAESAEKDFQREISTLSRLRHPNVVMFLGACSLPPDIALVMEYCPRGTLHRLLHRTAAPLPMSLRIRMATHVARGMLALHSSRPIVIHRDLKSANLLVSGSYEIKVCDFGLSRTLSHAAANCSNRSQSSFGTVEYAAPEVLRGEPYSERCDVWSFGVVLWEILTRKRPYSEVTHSVSIIAGVSLGKLSLPPIQDIGIPQNLAALVPVCCSQDPMSRPTFVELLAVLETAADALKAAGLAKSRSQEVSAMVAAGVPAVGGNTTGANSVSEPAASASDMRSPFGGGEDAQGKSPFEQ